VNGATIVVRANFDRKPAGRGEAKDPQPGRRNPGPVAHVLALAHHIERKIRDGELRDYAHAAEALGVSRARVSQIAALTLLVPTIQEAILELPLVTKGRERISERELRPIVTEPDWTRQLAAWRRLCPTSRRQP